MAASNKSGRGGGSRQWGTGDTGVVAGGVARGGQEGPTRIRRTEGTAGRGRGGGTGRPAPAKVRPEDAPRIPGEKSVRRTGATVPVAPPKRSRKAEQPMPPAAVDHRRQVVGTDDPKTHVTEAEGGRRARGATRGKTAR
jgi:hypothetical protein